MSRIRVLPEAVVNKIAAGEVVERPASVVKELMENSLDAEATRIFIDLQQAGRSLIRVVDDGCGMTADECLLAVERYATSKIRSAEDLLAVQTLGFRGEALPSLAAVSRMRLLSKVRGARSATLVRLEGGRVVQAAEADGMDGTTIEVADLFYNTPARLKFLKPAQAELAAILRHVHALALATPGVHVRLTHNGKILLNAPRAAGLRERVAGLYGFGLAKELLGLRRQEDGATVEGLVSPPSLTRTHRDELIFYVNNRPVRDQLLAQAVLEGYRPTLARDHFPLVFLFLTLDPGEVDVNVHPTKAWVRFQRSRAVGGLLTEAIREVLRSLEVTPVPRSADTAPLAPHPGPLAASGGPGGPVPVGEGQGTLFREAEAHYQASGIFGQPLGQMHDTYIVAYTADEVFFIDQHVAHERIIYERIKGELAGHPLPSQTLLFPQPLDLPLPRRALLDAWRPQLEQFGFTLEPFGGTGYLLRSVPSVLKREDPERLVDDLLKELPDAGQMPASQAHDRVLSFVACRAAIKANQPLEREEIAGLIDDLGATASPFFCPHGRPIVSRIPFREIKRGLKREW